MTRLCGLLARMKLRQARGGSYFAILINLGVITANIRLFLPTAELWWYIVAGMAWVIVTAIVGYVDEFHGIWKAEMNYASGAINPFLQNMSDKLDELDEKITKLGGK